MTPGNDHDTRSGTLMSESTATTPAGWYPAPDGSGAQWYWDGAQWQQPHAGATAPAVVPGADSAAAPPKGKHTGRNVTLGIVGGIVVILVISAIAGGTHPTKRAAAEKPATIATPAKTHASASAPAPAPVTVPDVTGQTAGDAAAALTAAGLVPSYAGDDSQTVASTQPAAGGTALQGSTVTLTLNPAATVGQQQALLSAQEYLSDGQGFSQAKLLEQLTSSYGAGFPQADAQWAIAQLNPDWNAQAANSAKGYMRVGGYSKQALYDQLTSSYGEGFTPDQANYALTQVGY